MTSSMNLSFQPQLRRFMTRLALSGCCFRSDKVKRFIQRKFSPTVSFGSATVFAICHIENPMTGVLDTPVTPYGSGESLQLMARLLM